MCEHNPIGLVFWQAGVKAHRGLTPDKQAYIVCNPLGLVFQKHPMIDMQRKQTQL